MPVIKPKEDSPGHPRPMAAEDRAGHPVQVVADRVQVLAELCDEIIELGRQNYVAPAPRRAARPTEIKGPRQRSRAHRSRHWATKR